MTEIVSICKFKSSAMMNVPGQKFAGLRLVSSSTCHSCFSEYGEFVSGLYSYFRFCQAALHHALRPVRSCKVRLNEDDKIPLLEPNKLCANCDFGLGLGSVWSSSNLRTIIENSCPIWRGKDLD